MSRIEELEEKYAIRAKKKKASGISEAKKLIDSYLHEIQCLELRLYGKMQLEKKAIFTGDAG